jgi:hypothetical protein
MCPNITEVLLFLYFIISVPEREPAYSGLNEAEISKGRI